MARKPAADGPLPATAPPLEFSRTVALEDLHGRQTEFDFRATDDEAAALAARFGVERISDFKTKIILTPFASGNKVALTAKFSAEIGQICVVTLAPLTNRVEGEFFAEFVQGAFADGLDDIEFSVDDDDPPEPIVDGRMELGELTAQNLGLAIDPFPRATGAVFDAPIAPNEAPVVLMSDGRPSPFSVLERLKTDKK